jgi:glycosyltransferase involved in cell wall biosynthesis
LAELTELRGEPVYYDVVDFQFADSTMDIAAFRGAAKKIIFTPMESLLRNGVIDKSLKTICGSGLKELWLTKKSDVTVCVSEMDSRMLKRFSRNKKIIAVPTGLSMLEFKNELLTDYRPMRAKDKKRTVVYLAYFGSPSNVQALEWYLRDVHQIVSEKVGDYEFLIVGHGDLSRFRRYENEHLRIVGPVDKLALSLSGMKVGIAPALSGSGFRGKISQYAICGVPCVASPLAADGLAYKAGKEIFVEGNPKRFARQIVSLLVDDDLNQRISAAARECCVKNYTWESQVPAILKIYGDRNGILA